MLKSFQKSSKKNNKVQCVQGANAELASAISRDSVGRLRGQVLN